MSTPVTQDQLKAMGNEVRTRSGRVVKAPVRYEPVEQVEDDYAEDDYDTHESDVSSDVSYETDEIEDDDEDLDGFIVPDKNESDSEDTNGGQSSVPLGKRTPTQKRPAPVGKRLAGAR